MNIFSVCLLTFDEVTAMRCELCESFWKVAKLLKSLSHVELFYLFFSFVCVSVY